MLGAFLWQYKLTTSQHSGHVRKIPKIKMSIFLVSRLLLVLSIDQLCVSYLGKQARPNSKMFTLLYQTGLARNRHNNVSQLVEVIRGFFATRASS